MSRILFIVADEDLQRQLYAQQKMPYWSARFDVILEKEGYLAFDTKSHTILADKSNLAPYSVLIVGWLPEDAWHTDYLDAIQTFPGAVLIEGPLPAELEHLTGLRKEDSACPVDSGRIRIEDTAAKSLLANHFGAFLRDGDIECIPKHIVTRKPRGSRWDFDFSPEQIDTEHLYKRIEKAFRIPYINRILQGNFFPRPLDNLLSFYFLHVVMSKGWEMETTLSDAIKDSLSHFDFQRLTPPERALFTLVAIRYDCCPQHRADASAIKSFLREADTRHPQSAVVRLLLLNDGYDSAGLHLLINWAVSRVQESNNGSIQPAQGTLADLFAAAAILRLEDRQKADTLIDRLMSDTFDVSEGRFLNAAYKKGKLTRRDTFANSPLIGLYYALAVTDTKDGDYIGSTFSESFGADRLHAWSKDPLTFPGYSTVDAQVVANLLVDDEYRPAIARKNNVVTFTFPVLSHIVFYHTMHPLEGPFTDCMADGAMCLEALLFYLLEQLALDGHGELLQIAPWPGNSRYCMSVRHDVDRIPPTETMERLTNFEESKGLGVSWYWIFNRVNPQYIENTEKLGHEIALHSMKHHSKEEELKALGTYLIQGNSIGGEFIHGGGGGEYWLGYPSIAASKRCGLEYSEGVSTLYDFPYRFPYLHEDGTVQIEDIVCLSHSVSIDRHNVPQGADAWNRGRVNNIIDNGFYFMVLNHPDQYFPRLVEIESQVPQNGRLDWTCREVADWWRRTHTKENLSISVDMRSDSVEREVLIISKYDVDGLKIRLTGSSRPLSLRDTGVPLDIELTHSQTRLGAACTDILLGQLQANSPIRLVIS